MFDATKLKNVDFCMVNNAGDLAMIGEAKPFISRKSVFMKITKAGLYQVQLESKPKQNLCVGKTNISEWVGE